ncbi:MAG: hypothetical protein M0036_11440 [Desulfobacteraceae bacterium]|nr:hypothetical protein [Desulfobacteraceae bacterium]
MLFDKPGPANTLQTLQAAFERARVLGIEEIVVASASGATALRAQELFKDCKIVAVTYHCGIEEPFQTVMTLEERAALEAKGVALVMATHALSGIERAVARKFSGIYPALLIAETLRLFGQGVKVAVEISVMAADAGVLSGKDIIAIGGTARGADAAVVIKPANQSDFFDLRIREVICKPRSY